MAEPDAPSVAAMRSLLAALTTLERWQGRLARDLRTADPALALILGRRWQAVQRQVSLYQRLLGRRPAARCAPAVHSEGAVARGVPDGDGLNLSDGRRVRYLGLDAPEIMTPAGVPEPWALAAKALNERLVAGKRVRLLADGADVDKYGRLLRYVFCEGVFVNAQILWAGLARWDARALDLRHAAVLQRCEAAARAREVGLWLP